jgi:hypothetical protein
MTHLLRALWRRLLPPGGDVAVAREPMPRRGHWLLVYPASLDPGDLWLPYSAIADPGAEP